FPSFPTRRSSDLSLFFVSPGLSFLIMKGVLLSIPSTFLGMNSPSVSSLENSTESCFVEPSMLGIINLPLGNPSHSLPPSSEVLENIQATYGGFGDSGK